MFEDSPRLSGPVRSANGPVFLSLRFNGHFPGGPGLAGTRMSPFGISLELRMMEAVVTTGAIRAAQSSSQNVTTKKVKVKVHTFDILPLNSEAPSQKRSGMACVLTFICTPTRSSAIGMSHTCLYLPSRRNQHPDP